MSDGLADNMGVVDNLLVIIAVAFLIQMVFPAFTELFYFDPDLALAQPWRFITSMFLHGGLLHIFFNGYALYLFGKLVESKIGGREFLKVYFASGIAGGILYYITYLLGLTNAPALGASGAIFGIMGVAAFLYPNMRLIIFPLFFPVDMKTAVLIWIALSFFGIFDTSSGIAAAAHLGGLLVGLAYGKMIKDSIQNEYYWWLE